MNKEQQELIDNASEDVLYFIIDSIGSLMWRMQHDAVHGKIDIHPGFSDEINQMRNTQEYCVSKLIPFGVDPESTTDMENGSYWKWYRFWDKWKNSLTDEQWNTLDERMSNHEDYSEFLPKNKWND